MRRFISRYLSELGHLLRNLSLDVVLGACVMNYFLGNHWHTHLGATEYLILAGVVWLIYTLDHLWDAFQIPHQAHTRRHRFHQKYFWTLTFFWIIIALLVLYAILFFLDYQILYYGLIVGSLALFHFFLGWWDQVRNSMFIQKESRIALVYAFGVALSPWVLAHCPGRVADIILLLGIFLIAWVNLLLISLFEKDIDEKDGHLSVAQSLGENRLRAMIWYLISFHLIVMGLTFIFTYPYGGDTWLVQILMMLTLSWIVWDKVHFRKGERYRWLSDGVFFYPLLLLLMPYG